MGSKQRISGYGMMGQVGYTFFPSMGEYPVYDDAVYDAFGAADARRRSYGDAIERSAAGKVVLDIGTGRDALWALQAARCDARHVYAIEAQPDAAARARSAITASGLGDRVTLLPGLSLAQTLPVRAELCVSEIVGNIASAEGAIAALNDARARLCTPDCAWIPFRMQTWVAAVDLSAAGPLAVAEEAQPYLRRVLAAAGSPVPGERGAGSRPGGAVGPLGGGFEPRLCLGGPAADAVISGRAAVESAVFDGRQPAPSPEAVTDAAVTIERPGRMTGLLLWARIAVDSHGRELDALDGTTRGWAPVHVGLPPVEVGPGDVVRVRFERRTSDDGLHPDYVVRSRLELRSGERSHRVGGSRASLELPVWHSPHHAAGDLWGL